MKRDRHAARAAEAERQALVRAEQAERNPQPAEPLPVDEPPAPLTDEDDDGPTG